MGRIDNIMDTGSQGYKRKPASGRNSKRNEEQEIRDKVEMDGDGLRRK